MFTRKRLCPYHTDQFTQEQLQKKPCLESGRAAGLAAPEDSMEWETQARQHTDTQASERLNGDYSVQEQNKSTGFSPAAMNNNNNNNSTVGNDNNSSDMYMTPTDVCHRCQAGESGHYGHIGR